MSEKATITKREVVRFGDTEIKCADIVRTAQKDGTGIGYAVGLVCGEVKEGKKTRFALVPLAHIIEGRDKMTQATFNQYTGRFTAPEKAAAAVHKFAERFNVSVGNIAANIKVPEKAQKAEKKSAFEKVCAIIEKVPEGERAALIGKICEMYGVATPVAE